MKFKDTIPYIIIALLLVYITSMKKEVQTIHIPSRTNTKVITKPQPVKLEEDLVLEGAFATATKEVQIEMYKEAVTIREYEEELVDSVQTIKVRSKVQGKLLEQEITYTTNPITIEQKVVKSRTEFFVGGFTTVPTVPEMKFGVGAEIMIRNNKKIYNIGYDNNGNIHAGVTFKLF